VLVTTTQVTGEGQTGFGHKSQQLIVTVDYSCTAYLCGTFGAHQSTVGFWSSAWNM